MGLPGPTYAGGVAIPVTKRGTDCGGRWQESRGRGPESRTDAQTKLKLKREEGDQRKERRERRH